ncbi:hypothetical protein GCM10007079_18530 [Nocardiopsis terrae]|nr:hypothetical protein GCM10007079_18530 [Nocardiopsis terrae]
MPPPMRYPAPAHGPEAVADGHAAGPAPPLSYRSSRAVPDAAPQILLRGRTRFRCRGGAHVRPERGRGRISAVGGGVRGAGDTMSASHPPHHEESRTWRAH